MKILHFTHTYIPVYGGTTTRLMNLFSEDGNQHTMVVPYEGSQYVPANIKNLNSADNYLNIHIKRMPLSNPIKSSKLFIDYGQMINNWNINAKELVHNLENTSFDIIYGHNPMEFALAAKYYSVRYKIPLIYEIHGLVKDTLFVSSNPVKKVYNTLGNFFIKRMEKSILNQATYIIVQTKRMKDRVADEYHVASSNIEVICNGVDIQRFSAAKYKNSKTDLEAEMHLESKVVFSYFGFLDNNNGIEFLLKALNNLPHDTKSRIKVLVIGRGPYSKLVGDFAANNDFLDFLGPVEYEHIPRYYSVTDMFVIPRPSNQATENLVPVKLLEAMSMENIVLVSNVHGMTDVVTDGKDGVVYRERDIDDFQSKFIDIVNNIDKYKLLGKVARSTILHSYSWGKTQQKLREIYKKAILY